MNNIRKVVIPAAGFRHAFSSSNKSHAKEMLPIVDKPVIQYVAEEAVASGIKDIIIVTGALKRAIEDHFDVPNAELIKNLENSAAGFADEVNKISNMANFILVSRKGRTETGTPIFKIFYQFCIGYIEMIFNCALQGACDD